MKILKKIAKFIIKNFENVLYKLSTFLPYPLRIKYSLTQRPAYAYCLYHSAKLAKKLGLAKISVIEFGVASGNGLRYLEIASKKVEKLVGVDIEIYGFDNGDGLPEPMDYRDLPYHWKSGFFKMDKARLDSVLNRSKIVVGNIEDTSKTFFDEYKPAPIGAVFHDFDFYSSSKIALNLFKANNEKFLPRVFNYFDDTIGTETELYNDFTGERLAIKEFNDENKYVKFSPAYHLICNLITFNWHYKIWISHFFKHKLYNSFVSAENQQILMEKNIRL